ncbi:MAG: TfoX/Sxy family protein [Firmicutes bacterium]|nr:TfoX/Sxy family protein [Bacillota bacterium]
MTELTSLRNIGKGLEQKLRSVDITTAEEFMEIGSEEAFVRLREQYSNISLVHLYALEGAVSGVDFNKLSAQTKKRLKDLNDSFK